MTVISSTALDISWDGYKVVSSGNWKLMVQTDKDVILYDTDFFPLYPETGTIRARALETAIEGVELCIATCSSSPYQFASEMISEYFGVHCYGVDDADDVRGATYGEFVFSDVGTRRRCYVIHRKNTCAICGDLTYCRRVATEIDFLDLTRQSDEFDEDQWKFWHDAYRWIVSEYGREWICSGHCRKRITLFLEKEYTQCLELLCLNRSKQIQASCLRHLMAKAKKAMRTTNLEALKSLATEFAQADNLPQ